MRVAAIEHDAPGRNPRALRDRGPHVLNQREIEAHQIHRHDRRALLPVLKHQRSGEQIVVHARAVIRGADQQSSRRRRGDHRFCRARAKLCHVIVPRLGCHPQTYLRVLSRRDKTRANKFARGTQNILSIWLRPEAALGAFGGSTNATT